MFLIDQISDTHISYIALYQRCSNDYILVTKSASKAKNLGVWSRTTMALLLFTGVGRWPRTVCLSNNVKSICQ